CRAGHNDVHAGRTVTKGDELSQQIGFLHNSIGTALAPQESWLLMRGLKTLALRMERHQSNAMKLTAWLEQHPLVDKVYYPGLPTHPQHDIQSKQSSGNTGIFSFRVKSAALVEP